MGDQKTRDKIPEHCRCYRCGGRGSSGDTHVSREGEKSDAVAVLVNPPCEECKGTGVSPEVAGGVGTRPEDHFGDDLEGFRDRLLEEGISALGIPPSLFDDSSE